MSGVTGAVAELLAAHELIVHRPGGLVCSCMHVAPSAAALHQHQAEAIAASGLLVPTAEVEAVAERWDRNAASLVDAGRIPGSLSVAALDLRALLARLAPGGTGTTEAEVQR